MSRIPLIYHTNITFYTQYTHPTLICRGMDARTDGRMENIYSIFRNKLLLPGEHILPKDLIIPTIRWYHQVTGHPGSKRLYQHIHQQYYNCDLRRLVDNFKCIYCQRNKSDSKGYGFLPECKVRLISFEECAMDLIGPWTLQVRGNQYKFEALSVIDTVTNLVELIRINDKRSKTVARKFTQGWLMHYLWPQRCVHDPGIEFTGPEFQMLIQNCHIRDVCTTAKNPQSKAVCERMHQTVGNVLRTLLHGNPQQNIANAAQHVDKALLIAMHAMQAGVHSTLGSSPGNLVFNRDMFLNIPLIADWHAITQRREHPLKDKILIWQNILYQVLDMSTQYNILYHTIQYIVFNKNLIISFKTVHIVITKKYILSNNIQLF
jgi:hypothetical protein